jgi:serine/threonine protein kinase
MAEALPSLFYRLWSEATNLFADTTTRRRASGRAPIVLSAGLKADLTGSGAMCGSTGQLTHLCPTSLRPSHLDGRCVASSRDCSRKSNRHERPAVAFSPLGSVAINAQADAEAVERGRRLVLRNGTVKEFKQLVRVTKVLNTAQKGSASNTVIAFGTMRDTNLPIVLKIWVECNTKDLETSVKKQMYTEIHSGARQQMENAIRGRVLDLEATMDKQEFEAKVYRALAKIGPQSNIVRYVNHFTLWTYPSALSATTSLFETVDPMLQDLETEIFNILQVYNTQIAQAYPFDNPFTQALDFRIHFLVTEHRPNSVSLFDMLAAPKLTDIDMRSLMFQLLFALLTLSRHGIQHNDMHPGNVLIDLEPNESHMSYEIAGRRYVVNTGYVGKVLLFDWDLGHCEPCGANTQLEKLELCTSYGVCDKQNERFDLYTILTYTYDNTVSRVARKEFKMFVDAMLGPTKTRDTYRKERTRYRMCNPSGYHTCAPYPDGQPKQVRTLTQALLDPYFDVLQSV